MRVLVTNVFGDLNKGDKALVETLVNVLLEQGATEISLVAIYNESLHNLRGVENIHKPLHRLSMPKKVLIFLYPFILFFGVLNIKFKHGFRWLISTRQLKLIEAYRNADLVLSCPGGFLEDSNKSYYLNLYQLVLAILNKNKIIVAPQSIGPIKSKLGRTLLGWVLKNCEKVFVRETFSENFLLQVIKVDRKKVLLSTDMAFYMKGVDYSQEKNKSIMYSTVVNWNFPESDDKDLAMKEYISALVDVYNHINKKYNKKIVILNQVETDLPLAYKIQELLPSIVSVDKKSYSPEQMISMISKTEFFLGTRFHSCIFSMMSNVPFMAISYLPKTKGILDWMGLSNYNVDIYNIDEGYLKESVDSIIGNQEYHRKLIGDQVEMLKRNDTFSSIIHNYING
ncbi:polysaccharide pyruvyl transferase family protein [Ekhidna sp.]|uniref:polysaccharide pyruvyl transferase family protein n=1 Tax=Ekhidna sp. TaxID=2608089 RepID=UPI003BAC3375